MKETIDIPDFPAQEGTEQITVPEIIEQKQEKPAILVQQFNTPFQNADGQVKLAAKIAEIEAQGYENYSIINIGMCEAMFFFRLKGGN